MQDENAELAAGIAVRDEIANKSRDLEARAAKLAAAKAERDQASAALDEITRRDAEALSEWARAGATGKAPAGDPKAREAAARRFAAADDQARAIDGAIGELAGQQLALAEQMKSAQRRVQVARARVFAAALSDATAKLRDTEDEKATLEAVADTLRRQTFALDVTVGSAAAQKLEAERVAWIQQRASRIDAAVAARVAEIHARIPG